jgi:uncharacterized protein
VDAGSAELRVLGSLIEKQRTTPDADPLSLNALRAACNQTTNRDPVVEYDEETVRSALRRLEQRRWVRLASGRGSRAVKFRHLFDEALGIGEPELAILAVLMLRGDQTVGELKARAERLHPFASLAEVHETLDRMIERELVVRLSRRPGQKEERYRQLLGGDEEAAAGADAPPADREPPSEDDLAARVGRLEAEVASLRETLATLRANRS